MSQPNARFQARERAGARHARRLFPVACKPLLGGWRPMPVPGPPGDRLPPYPVGRGPWRLPRRRAPGWRARGTTVPWTPARPHHAPRRWPGPAGARRGRLPCPPPDPAAHPHAAQKTPTLSWRRTRRHRDPAATLPLVAVTRHPPPAGALAPARACCPPQPHGGRSRGHHDGPAHLRVPELPPPARTGSAVGTGDHPTPAADRA